MEKYVTVINCMDGRVQLPVYQYMTNKYNADYVDMITEAGPNKILSEGKNRQLIDSIKSRFNVSVTNHDSRVVSVVGHFDCGGNSAGENRQIEQIKIACNIVNAWHEDVEVIGLWVDESWTVHEIVW